MIVPFESNFMTDRKQSFVDVSKKDHLQLQGSIDNIDDLVTLVDTLMRDKTSKGLDNSQRYKFAKLVIQEELHPAVRLFAYLLFAGQNLSTKAHTVANVKVDYDSQGIFQSFG